MYVVWPASWQPGWVRAPHGVVRQVRELGLQLLDIQNVRVRVHIFQPVVVCTTHIVCIPPPDVQQATCNRQQTQVHHASLLRSGTGQSTCPTIMQRAAEHLSLGPPTPSTLSAAELADSRHSAQPRGRRHLCGSDCRSFSNISCALSYLRTKQNEPLGRVISVITYHSTIQESGPARPQR